MLSPSSQLTVRVLYQRTPIPSVVQNIRKQYRKFVNGLLKGAPSLSYEEVGKQGQCRISLQETKTPPLLDLPLELFLMINNLLSLESHICLALTCKSLHGFYKHVLASPQYRFLPSNVYDREFLKNCDNFNTERWKLLCLLENEQWHCCSTCLKLHPTNEFSSRAILARATNRVCTLGKVGIVNLCPCINITFRDKNRLIEQLKNENTLNCTYILHKCFLRNGLTDIITKISTLICGDDELFIYTQYAVFVRGSSMPCPTEHLRRVFCPHLSFYHYFFEFTLSESERDLPYSKISLDEPQTFPYEAYQRGLYCKYCDTTIYIIKSNLKASSYHRRNTFFEIVTVRNLGQATSANDTWRYQTVYPSSWSGFGNTPFHIRYPHSLRAFRDSRKHDPWDIQDSFCYRCIPTLTENKSHCCPRVLEDLTSNEISPDNEHFYDSDTNIDDSVGFLGFHRGILSSS